ncbi:MAG: hypothetical protein AB7Y46_00410 [Armatimonadota bacterium]
MLLRRLTLGRSRHAFLAAVLVLMPRESLCQPETVPLSVGGWIDGYFLTPDGELGLHTLTLSSEGSSPDGIALHPLWAGYRVRLNFTPNEAVHTIMVTGTESGEVLAERRFDRPRNWPGLLLLCPGDGGFCHVCHGLSYRVEVAYADGRTATATASVRDARLLPVPELKIDWIDLVRIKEVRRWLREAGDNLLPGLRADDVPFVLEGEDGQVVLVGWPSAPEGFRRYEGPTPLDEPIYVGALGDQELIEIEDAVGYAGKVRGTLAVRLPRNPDWGSAFTARGRATGGQRAETILHEVCHVNWYPRVRAATTGRFGVPPLEARALEETARRLLSEADARADGYPRVHQYLALMEERDRLMAGIPGARDQWRREETSEAYAYYVSWLARAALDEAIDSSPLVDLRSPWPLVPLARMERAVTEALRDRYPDWGGALNWWVVAHAEYHGFREIAMLYQMDPVAVRRAWSRGTDVRDALAAASGYADLSPDLKRRVLYAAKQGTGYRERLAAYEDESAQGTSAILARFARPTGPGPSPVLLRGRGTISPDVPRPHASGPQFLEVFGLGIGEVFHLELKRPAVVRAAVAEGGWCLEVQTLLEEVSVLREHVNGAPLEVDREEMRLYAASARVTDDGGVLVVTLGSGDGE